MSLWSRAAAGVGGAAASLANKYIDEELVQMRAQAIADIQRKSAMQQAEDADAFNNNAGRVERNRANRVADVSAEGRARNAVSLEGAEAQASSPTLRQAAIDNSNAITAGTVQTRIDAENAIVEGTAPKKLQAEVARAAAMLPLEVKRAYALADASASASARYREPRENAASQIGEKMAAVEKALGRPLTESERLGLLGLGAKGRDPELDTVTVTEEKIGPNGEITKTQRKEVRRPGAGGEAQKMPEPEAHKAARDAIAAGAPAAAVNARLKEQGYAPLGGGSLADSARSAKKDEPKARMSGQINMDNAATKAGYTLTIGKNGQDYYSKGSEILTPELLAEKLGLVY